MGHGAVRPRGLKCKCGREAFVLHPASGQPLCKKHFLRYLYKKVIREAASLGLLKCESIKIKIDDVNLIEGKIVYEAIRDWSKRKSCPQPKESDEGIYPLSMEKVLYLLLKAFYELDERAYRIANPKLSGNPAYTLLPFELLSFAKLRNLPPPKPYGEGPLWEIAVEVSSAQPTEAFSSLKLIENLKALFPVV